MSMMISEDNYIGNALNRARGQYDNAIGKTQRTMEKYGINPNSGRYQSMMRDAQFGEAAGLVSAANEAGFNWLKMAQSSSDNDDLLGYRYAALRQEANDNAAKRELQKWEIKQNFKYKLGEGKGSIKGNREAQSGTGGTLKSNLSNNFSQNTFYVPGATVDAFRRRYEERSEWRKGMGLTENDPADDQFNELYDKYLSTLKQGEDGYLHETDETDNATFIPDGVETPSDEDVQKTLKFREFVKGKRIKQMNSIADEFKKNFMAQRQKAFESGGREDLDGNIVDPGVNWNILYNAEENNKILSRVEDFMKMGYSEQKAWSAVLYSNHLLGGDSEKLFEKIYPDAKNLKTESEIVGYAKAGCEKEKPFEERFFPSRALPFPNLFK